MASNFLSESDAHAKVLELARIERLRDALPTVTQILGHMAGRFPTSLIEELLIQDEALVVESERLRDELSEIEPDSLEAAISQVLVAERDWLSADPLLQLRAISMTRRAARYLMERRIAFPDSGELLENSQCSPLNSAG